MRMYIYIFLMIAFNAEMHGQGLRNTKIDGYKGIWFELNQKYEYGDKYSGGLGTYTANHQPMALYSAKADKTFFVYGGTTGESERHLLCMIGSFDHKTGMVSKPVVVYDKLSVNDPHDNPTISIDDQGFLWVFVSGRGNSRVGIKLKSRKPFTIDTFDIVSEEVFTYPQIWRADSSFFHFFTKYTGMRELYFETSRDGINWSADVQLAGIKGVGETQSGHYQVSGMFDNRKKFGTFFNRHINGNVDTRTDLYYIQTHDFGKTWLNISQEKIRLPVKEVESITRVVNYHAQGKNVYLMDMDFDKAGNPICLYLTSGGHEPGPKNAPYNWYVTYFRNGQWSTRFVCESDHNYDMGSLYVIGPVWKVVAPTENPPQKYGVGGEIAVYESSDNGEHWTKKMIVTNSSVSNHGYVRRPLNYRTPFCYYWASGDPQKLSKSELYFGDFNGHVWMLPYTMKEDLVAPFKVDY